MLEFIESYSGSFLILSIVCASFALAGLFVLLARHANGAADVSRFWAWLKGSRTSYFLNLARSLEFGSGSARPDMYGISSSVIEVNRGLFRRNKIHELGHTYWQITAVSPKESGNPLVDLQDSKGLRMDEALQVVSHYPSLQAMLDRIAELERTLENANKKRAD